MLSHPPCYSHTSPYYLLRWYAYQRLLRAVLGIANKRRALFGDHHGILDNLPRLAPPSLLQELRRAAPVPGLPHPALCPAPARTAPRPEKISSLPAVFLAPPLPQPRPASTSAPRPASGPGLRLALRLPPRHLPSPCPASRPWPQPSSPHFHSCSRALARAPPLLAPPPLAPAFTTSLALAFAVPCAYPCASTLRPWLRPLSRQSRAPLPPLLPAPHLVFNSLHSNYPCG